MVVDGETVKRIEKQARLYDAKKNQVITRIRNNVRTAIEKLKAAERDLLDEVKIEFGENPFAKLLESIYSGNHPTQAKVEATMAKSIPKDFGPSEESFFSLYREIEAFKSWRKEEDEGAIGVDGSKEFVKISDEEEKPMQCGFEMPMETSEWSCSWKMCPDDVNSKHFVDWSNPKIATKTTGGFFSGETTVVGDTLLPPNKMTLWCVNVLNTWRNDGSGIYIGVAPFDINQNAYENSDKCGWYFYCCTSTLCSGPPHNYRDKPYGPRKGEGKYVNTGSTVGVVMDTEKGELSFALDGMDIGVAYARIPLNKPLVPCVLLYWKDDSVEFVTLK